MADGASALGRRFRRGATAAAGGLLAVGIGFAGWQAFAGAERTSNEQTGDVVTVAEADAPVVVVPGLDGQSGDGLIEPSATTVSIPALVGSAAFGERTELGGWRMAVTKPYPCPVLRTVPALMTSDSQLIRMTVTLVNNTDSAQQARSWVLDATADGRPAELVIWPAAGFHGVPDRLLAPGESVRFLVAARVPNERTRFELGATRAAADRLTFGGIV